MSWQPPPIELDPNIAPALAFFEGRIIEIDEMRVGGFTLSEFEAAMIHNRVNMWPSFTYTMKGGRMVRKQDRHIRIRCCPGTDTPISLCKNPRCTHVFESDEDYNPEVLYPKLPEIQALEDEPEFE